MNVRVTKGAEGLERRAFTVDEIWRMVETGIIAPEERFELIEGELVPMSPKGPVHETVKSALAIALAKALPETLSIFIETTLELSDMTFVEPDLGVYLQRARAARGPRHRHPPRRRGLRHEPRLRPRFEGPALRPPRRRRAVGRRRAASERRRCTRGRGRKDGGASRRKRRATRSCHRLWRWRISGCGSARSTNALVPPAVSSRWCNPRRDDILKACSKRSPGQR